jgi:hypothetical protein
MCDELFQQCDLGAAVFVVFAVLVFLMRSVRPVGLNRIRKFSAYELFAKVTPCPSVAVWDATNSFSAFLVFSLFLVFTPSPSFRSRLAVADLYCFVNLRAVWRAASCKRLLKLAVVPGLSVEQEKTLFE